MKTNKQTGKEEWGKGRKAKNRNTEQEGAKKERKEERKEERREEKRKNKQEKKSGPNKRKKKDSPRMFLFSFQFAQFSSFHRDGGFLFVGVFFIYLSNI